MYTDWTALPSHYLAPSSAEFSRLKTPPVDREQRGCRTSGSGRGTVGPRSRSCLSSFSCSLISSWLLISISSMLKLMYRAPDLAASQTLETIYHFISISF